MLNLIYYGESQDNFIKNYGNIIQNLFQGFKNGMEFEVRIGKISRNSFLSTLSKETWDRYKKLFKNGSKTKTINVYFPDNSRNEYTYGDKIKLLSKYS